VEIEEHDSIETIEHALIEGMTPSMVRGQVRCIEMLILSVIEEKLQGRGVKLKIKIESHTTSTSVFVETQS
jgi:hypothetical protein